MSSQAGQVLVVDDESEIRELISHLLEREGFSVLIASEGESALKTVRTGKPDVVLSDIKMPGMDGMELLKSLQKLDPELPVVLITGYGDIPGAVEAMQAGAYDYLVKPFQHHETIQVLRRAMDERHQKLKGKFLAEHMQRNASLSEMMGPSEAVGELISLVNCVADSDLSVIVYGETGSGKELVARAIHNNSNRSGASLQPVDCGAIPETLLENELFGHEKGSFTGAQERARGKFEAARKGTLFLDEISNMPLNAQAKLLRVLQEKKIYRIGDTSPIDVDVRLLVATNEDLTARVSAGVFREDLFYRLNEFSIRVPPLRERREDIPYLAKCFLDITGAELNRGTKDFSESALQMLVEHDWPGNVRELRSVIRRAALLADDEKITEKHLELNSSAEPVRTTSVPDNKTALFEGLSLKEIVSRNTVSVEREVLMKTLRHTAGNKAKAARMLQIDYKTIHTKIKQLGINTNGGDHNGQKTGGVRF
ncbi:MAG: sigma-54 dependent transcriptional regulator [Desulfobacteraceae bacterium]|nr:sigma-54 dependent transcriptional regulator [Desulfobacteraceae bacterium]